MAQYHRGELIDVLRAYVQELHLPRDATSSRLALLRQVAREKLRALHASNSNPAVLAAQRTQIEDEQLAEQDDGWIIRALDHYARAAAGRENPPLPEQFIQHVAGVSSMAGALTPSQRREAVRTLAIWIRQNVPDRERLYAYLQGPDSETTKTRVLGELAVLLARAEFLLGWAYAGGYQTAGDWEEGRFHEDTEAQQQLAGIGTGQNIGEFPRTYLSASHWPSTAFTLQAIASDVRFDTAKERREKLPWCTAFVGSLVGRLGFEYYSGNPAAGHMIFLSTFRLGRWAETGRSVGGVQLNPPDDLVTSHVSGARVSLGSTLRSRVEGVADPDQRRAAVAAFFDEREFLPQAGDVILAKGHTAMVESYDPATAVVTTIEGNADSAVRSRRVELANPDADFGPDWIRTLVRIPAAHFAGQGIVTTDNQDGDDIIRDARRYVDFIAHAMRSRGWISGTSGTATESTSTWQGVAYTGQQQH